MDVPPNFITVILASMFLTRFSGEERPTVALRHLMAEKLKPIQHNVVLQKISNSVG
jgi:hypothetical protein